MAQYTRGLDPGALKDNVIVITGTIALISISTVSNLLGGANGIGAALVEYACEHGAYVCFGDLAAEAGEAIATKVNGSNSSPPRAVFVQTDVTSYDSVLKLFDTAMDTYGRIDHAVAGAGISEIGNVFDPGLDMESIRQVRLPL
jgi:NAD(P)-dependent dehydrogenase (short-subunit alcohol dehydrogenase family)